MSDQEHSNHSHCSGLLVVVVLSMIFFFIWPGVLRYEYRDYAFANRSGAQGSQTLMKIDRLTHNFWLFNGGKWHKQ